MKVEIREAATKDADGIWEIIHQVISGGETYVFHPQTPKSQMLDYWLSEEKHTYVAILDGVICGTYIMKPNHQDLGSHVANASYMVHPNQQGKGLGRLMGEHSLVEARRIGYHALQFNLVVKTNESAFRLWKKLGFEVIGEIPEAFQHPTQGLINAYIMYRKL